MADLVLFHAFVEGLAEGAFDLQNDTLKVALSNTAPTAASDSVLTDITQISAGNGYTAGGAAATVASSAQASGTYTLALTDLSPAFTASGGSIGPYRYLVLYDDTHASDGLIGYWDHGSSVSILDGDSLSFDFDAAALTIAPA